MYCIRSLIWYVDSRKLLSTQNKNVWLVRAKKNIFFFIQYSFVFVSWTVANISKEFGRITTGA